MNTRRRFLSLTVAALVMTGLVGCREFEVAPSLKADHLVDRAVATVERFQTLESMQRFSEYMPGAVAVAVFPSVIKAGFFIGGEGGNGLLTVKRPDGTWSAPAFYTMGAGSFGIQFGAQDTEIIIVIRNQGALEAILEDQAKIGADAGVTAGVYGIGAEASILRLASRSSRGSIPTAANMGSVSFRIRPFVSAIVMSCWSFIAVSSKPSGRYTTDVGTQTLQVALNIFVSTIDMINPIDPCLARCNQARDNQTSRRSEI